MVWIFFELLKPNCWNDKMTKTRNFFESTDMKLDIWSKQKYRWLHQHLYCKQLANGVSNCLEPPNFSLSHEYTHCTLRIYRHALLQNMKNCELSSVFVWVWQTSKVLQNWLTWNTNNPNKQGKQSQYNDLWLLLAESDYKFN